MKKIHKIYNGKMLLFGLRRREHVVVDTSLTRHFKSPQRNSVEYETQPISTNKNICVFCHRVRLFASLVPFGKNLASKHTIYFEWPKAEMSCSVTGWAYQISHLVDTQQLCQINI